MALGLPISEGSGLPLDPMTMQALQQQQLVQQVNAQGGTSAERANTMASQQAISSLFPSPAVQTAAKVQSALRDAQLTQKPGEGELDFSIRQLQAQRDAVAQYSPESAAALNTQLTKLAEMKFEQNKLTAQDQRAQQEADDKHKLFEAQQAAGANQYLVGPDNKLIGRYDMYQQDDRLGLAKAKADNPTARLYNQADYDKYLDTMQEIAERARETAEYKRLSLLNTGIAPGSEGMLAAQYATGWSGRMSAPERAVAMNELQAKGVTLGDQAAARADISALQSGARTIGARQANISTIENSLGSLGDQATARLIGLNNGQLKLLNSFLNAGKAQTNDPAVYQAFLATQALRTEYARLLRGGSVPDDQSMLEAKGLIPDNLDGRAMAGITEQIRKGEVPALKNGSDLALDAYTNPAKWKGLITLSRKLGIKTDELSDAQSNTGTVPTSPSGGAATQQPGAASTGPVKVSSRAEAMALAPGTIFVTPDGRQLVR